ncbi:MAG: AsmA family protein [Aquabacterium sp.]|nr:MAG: AsmA family protein [Aquabacterium sp.]
MNAVFEPVLSEAQAEPPLAPPPGRGRPRRRLVAVAATLVVVGGALAACEYLGWPFLAGPAERLLSQATGRDVALRNPGESSGLRIHLLGGLHIAAPVVTVAGPDWRPATPTLHAQGVRLHLRYADLWAAWRSSRQEDAGAAATAASAAASPAATGRAPALRIRSLVADRLEADLFRQPDGRATWQLGKAGQSASPGAGPATLPEFGYLAVRSGDLHYRDAGRELAVDSHLQLVEGGGGHSRLVAQAEGRYRKQPLTLELVSNGVLPWVAPRGDAPAVQMRMKGQVGGAHLSFEGTVTSALTLDGLSGRFDLSGPSMAAVGAPVGVTLPTTGAFRATGTLNKQGDVWQAAVTRGTLGSSKLSGDFRYDTSPRVPMLTGHLRGQVLALADLAPSVGAPAPQASEAGKAAARADGKVLPTREFDLPSMRAMDADVEVDIAEVDLGSAFSEPLRPLRARIELDEGRLTISEIDARAAAGHLMGSLVLDGSGERAAWRVDLAWDGVRLERWLKQDDAGTSKMAASASAKDAAPDAQPKRQTKMLAGSMAGEAQLEGQGRSTAEILGSLQGKVGVALEDASVSRLLVAKAGLDIARILGIYLRGDDDLPISCAVADMAAAQGVLKPRSAVIDTPDATTWLVGEVSLAQETMHLQVAVAPKKFSVASLRTPVEVHGSFAQPQVKLSTGPIVKRVAAAAVLSVAAPVAAVLPFFDTGDASSAKARGEECRKLARGYGNRLGEKARE